MRPPKAKQMYLPLNCYIWYTNIISKTIMIMTFETGDLNYKSDKRYFCTDR
jgi:hypothetical protein